MYGLYKGLVDGQDYAGVPPQGEHPLWPLLRRMSRTCDHYLNASRWGIDRLKKENAELRQERAEFREQNMRLAGEVNEKIKETKRLWPNFYVAGTFGMAHLPPFSSEKKKKNKSEGAGGDRNGRSDSKPQRRRTGGGRVNIAIGRLDRLG